MKKLILFACLLFFSINSFSQQFKPNESKPSVVPQPLIIIDGKVMPKEVKSKGDTAKFVNTLDAINPSDVAEMKVIKDLDALAAYGEAGRNGVIVITTRSLLNKTKEE